MNDEDVFGMPARKMSPTEEAYQWINEPEQEDLRNYIDWLASKAGDLGPWIRQIYPALHLQYTKYMDPETETDDVQDFSFVLLQYLHQ